MLCSHGLMRGLVTVLECGPLVEKTNSIALACAYATVNEPTQSLRLRTWMRFFALSARIVEYRLVFVSG